MLQPFFGPSRFLHGQPVGRFIIWRLPSILMCPRGVEIAKLSKDQPLPTIKTESGYLMSDILKQMKKLQGQWAMMILD